MIWSPEPGDLVVLDSPGETVLRVGAAAHCHTGDVGLVVGWAGNGLLEVLWPDGEVTGVWAGLGRIRPLAAEEAHD